MNTHFELENAVRETVAVLELLGGQLIERYGAEGDSMKDVATGTQHLVKSMQEKLTAAFDASWKERVRVEEELEAKYKRACLG